jgi:hypothetical protein
MDIFLIALLILFIILAIGTLNIACFFVGARLGQKAYKGEEIKLPEANPIKAVNERNERKAVEEAAKLKQIKLETILKNIDRYDGTEQGQIDV